MRRIIQRPGRHLGVGGEGNGETNRQIWTRELLLDRKRWTRECKSRGSPSRGGRGKLHGQCCLGGPTQTSPRKSPCPVVTLSLSGLSARVAHGRLAQNLRFKPGNPPTPPSRTKKHSDLEMDRDQQDFTRDEGFPDPPSGSLDARSARVPGQRLRSGPAVRGRRARAWRRGNADSSLNLRSTYRPPCLTHTT